MKGSDGFIKLQGKFNQVQPFAHNLQFALIHGKPENQAIRSQDLFTVQVNRELVALRVWFNCCGQCLDVVIDKYNRYKAIKYTVAFKYAAE